MMHKFARMIIMVPMVYIEQHQACLLLVQDGQALAHFDTASSFTLLCSSVQMYEVKLASFEK